MRCKDRFLYKHLLDRLTGQMKVTMNDDRLSRRAIFIIGPPGSGKSTIANVLSCKLGYDVFLSGQALREAAMNYPNLKIRRTIAHRMAMSRPMPLSVYSAVISRATENGIDRGLIVDGYPRTLEQCIAIPRILKSAGIPTASIIGIYLEAPKSVLIGRVLRRAAFNDDCVRRDDDNETTLRKRLLEHERLTLPIQNEFAKRWPLLAVNANSELNFVLANVIKQIVSTTSRSPQP